MGTWLGHAAPGTFFICFSVWWLVKSLHSYYSKPGRYKNTLMQLCCCRCTKKGLPIEGYVILLVAVLGVIMEVATGFASTQHVPMGNIQHLTMYISYGLVGLIAILRHHDIKFIPKGAEYLALLAALVIELCLFRFHLHNRAEVDKHLHMLLVYTIAGCIAAVVAEIIYPASINAAVARSFCFMLQGTWFHQIGVVLYPPANNGVSTWDLTEMENIMGITLIFSWHMIGCTMACLILSGLTFWCCSPRCSGDFSDEEAGVNLIPVRNGHKRLPDNDNDEQTTAIMNGYNSVASDDEDDMFTAPKHTEN